MNHIKYLSIGFLSLFLTHSSAQAASMTTPQIEMSVFSQDGIPVEGVTLAGMLNFEALTVKDCSGFICVPSLPKYKSISEGADLLGETDLNGRLEVKARTWKTKSLTARKLSVSIFTNGLIIDVCKDGNQSSGTDILSVLPQWMNGQPVERNPECQTLEIQNNETRVAEIKCYSSYTHAEIEKMKEDIRAKCR